MFPSRKSCKIFLLYLVFHLCSSVTSKMLDIDETTNVFDRSAFGDNDLWDSLYEQCGTKSSYGCVQDSLTSYIDRTLDSDFVTDAVSFRHNGNNYTNICARVKKDHPGDFNERAEREFKFEGDPEFSEFVEKVEEVEEVKEKKSRVGKDLKNDKNNTAENPSLETKATEDSASESSVKNIGDVTDIMYDRGLRYLMTHDVEVAVPLVGGGKVRISPQGFADDGGALVKLTVVPDQPQAQGRLFFKQIKKLFKKKLMSSMLAAMLILKLLKLKMMFFLPVLLGVGTAKKILLKVLLFLFPALAHLFKLCSYYHHKHAKYHHHHHQIAHHHHHIPVPIYTPVHTEHTAPGELPAPYPASYDATGPGVYHSRTEAPGSLADLAAWGLGEYPSAWDNNLAPATDPPRYNYPTRAQHQAAPTAQYATTADLKRLYAAAIGGSGVSKAQQYQAVTSRLQALTPRPAPAAAAAATSAVYDPFYSPMLQRLDAVFSSLGVADEGCRERVVCSMYKNPARFSPHSNLVSAELSRDPSELQKPLTANSAVVRFYRYLQAARDGQERKECLRLYPACAVATE